MSAATFENANTRLRMNKCIAKTGLEISSPPPEGQQPQAPPCHQTHPYTFGQERQPQQEATEPHYVEYGAREVECTLSARSTPAL